jgi:hypothetical protein
MTDIAREKYQRLMGRIETLEELIEELQGQAAGDPAPDLPAAEVRARELKDLTEQLAQARSELARLSDGCGKPHAH